MWRRLWCALLLLGLGCEPSSGQRDLSTPNSNGGSVGARPTQSVVIAGVPHVRQKPDFCGEAVAASYLQKLGEPYTQDQVFEMTGLDPALGMGATTRQLKQALERIGFDPGPVWHAVPAERADQELQQLFGELHQDLVAGVPSIVCTHYDDSVDTTEHFRLVLGYDAERDEVIYHEPAVDAGGYLRMAKSQFLALWPLKYRSDSWTVIRLRLAAGELVPAPRTAHTPRARLAQHVRQLKASGSVPSGFSIAAAPPFVVLGDDEPKQVRGWAQGVVGWAVTHLKQDFFDKDPDQILNIWLFRDEDSYRHHNLTLWGSEPGTPYGYYSSEQRALVMNIATGGGTLVHEIVHPFIEANFPQSPAWFNEGLGSLYEQSVARDGHIVGLTNWRLAGLQQAIRQRRLPAFLTLMSTTSHEFYEEDRGSNYAQARYLLFYLQERGLLRRYYREFVANVAKDPTGYKTLQAVLNVSDMQRFQQRWEDYVLSLSFP